MTLINLKRHIRRSRTCLLASAGSLVGNSEQMQVVIKLVWRERTLKIRSPGNLPIYWTMKKLGKKVGFPVKLLKFRHKGQVIQGSEQAALFDGEVIEVT